MRRDKVYQLLRQHVPHLRDTYRVKSLRLFGSHARDEASDTSDVDLLVEFHGLANFRGYMGLATYLEDLLGTPVDLVIPQDMRPRMLRLVEKEALHVA